MELGSNLIKSQFCQICNQLPASLNEVKLRRYRESRTGLKGGRMISKLAFLSKLGKKLTPLGTPYYMQLARIDDKGMFG